MLIIGFLQSRFHSLKHWNVPTILGLDWHFGDIDDLLFDQVLLIDEAQAPWFDELIRELSMKEYTALLDASRDPGFESRL